MGTPNARKTLLRGVGIGVGIAWVLAFAIQALIPAVAKVPGLLICGGDGFDLVIRRRTSYGVCGGDRTVHYAVVLVVSVLVWSLVCLPLGLLIARWRARRT